MRRTVLGVLITCLVLPGCGSSDKAPASPTSSSAGKLGLTQVCEQVRAAIPESPSKQEFDEGVEKLTKIAADAEPESNADILAQVALDIAEEEKDRADKQYAGKAPGASERFRADAYREIMQFALESCGEDRTAVG